MKFYPGDWRADPLLRSCEPISRYVWLEMIGLMHEAEPYGHLVFAGRPMTPGMLARNIAVDTADVESALSELEAMGVFSRTKDGIIFSRRMVRDEQKHRKASNFGKRGVKAKTLKEKDNIPTLKGSVEGGLEGSLEDTRQPRDQRPERKTKANALAKRPLAEDWLPTEFGSGSESREIVESWDGAERRRQLEAFRAHHRANGSRFVDWQQAWSTWALNSRKFDRSTAPKGEPQTLLQVMAERRRLDAVVAAGAASG